MLVLARNVNESVSIGDDIKVVVVSISGGVVRLGVTAPKEHRISRTDDQPKVPKHAKSYHPRKRLFCDPAADGQPGIQDNVRAVGSATE